MLSPDDVGREKLRRYKQVAFIGKGAFAEVYMHEDGLRNGAPVAIKKMLKDSFKSGVNLGAVKELQALQELSHPNVLQLLDTFSYGDRVHLVLEYAVVDLAAIIRDRAVLLTESHVKGFMQQLLRGLAYMHGAGFMHRDLKPDNVLVTSAGVVKLADMGHAARFPDVDKELYHRVVTIWYRAPELLRSSKHYGPAVDIWAAGCILGEMLLRQPLFPAGADSEAEQLAQIYRLMGTPRDPWATAGDAEADSGRGSAHAAGDLGTAEALPVVRSRHSQSALSYSVAVAACSARRSSRVCVCSSANAPAAAAGSAVAAAWPASTVLPAHVEFDSRPPQPWQAVFAAAAAAAARSVPIGGSAAISAAGAVAASAARPGALATDLLSRMLVFDPRARTSAAAALQHPWFREEPLPAPPDRLPVPDAVNRALAGARAAAEAERARAAS